jgi:nicotinate phosphoribosyltransferase
MRGQLAGTSNAYLAWQYDLPLKGTMAHELEQAMQGIILQETAGDYRELIHTRDRVMDAWEEEYGQSMWTNLPDTFGSDWALEHMTEERLRNWSIERQDSGDAYSFAQKRIDKWISVGLDPWGKKIIFSNALDVHKIISLYENFNQVTNTGFGWGTNLGNDLGLPPISIVVKLTQSQGYGVVKLSDNLCKATGKPEDIERVTRIFRYTEGKHEEVIY